MNKTQLGFEFISDDCIQCHACEVACITWRGLELGVRWRRVSDRFEGTFPNTKLITASVSCLHCNDPACVDVCPTGAIAKGEHGVVTVDQEQCIGCRMCFDVCPVGAPQYGADGLMSKCDLCAHDTENDPPCVRTCPARCLSRRFMTAEEKNTLDNDLIKTLGHGK